MYALNLDPVSNRILSATYPQYAPADAIIVDILPDGDISDYLYVNEEYVYDPLPDPEPVPDPELSVWDELDGAYQAGYESGYTEGVNSAYDE